MTLHVIAHVHARPEHLEAVREILEGFLAPTRAEDGCLVYDLFQNLDDPTHFTFVEEWSAQAALDAHARTRHITDGRRRLAPLTEGPTDVVRYGEVGTVGVRSSLEP